MGKALFVSGTGTDIGKTAVSLAVILWARANGLRVAYCKPIQCGQQPVGTENQIGGDADWIKVMAGKDTPTTVTYRLQWAASPHLASEREGVVIEIERLRRGLESLIGEFDLVIVEGAGGAAVPFDRKGTTLGTLAGEMGIPCLVACASGLGTLHHTLTTVAYLRSQSVPLIGFAFCHREPVVEEPREIPEKLGDLSDGPTKKELAKDNADTLQSLTNLPFFGSLPFAENLMRGKPMATAEALAWWSPLAASLDTWWNPKRK